MICENQELAIEKYGDRVSGRLMDIISDIDAANNISDIISGNPEKTMVGDILGYRINLIDGYIIHIISGHAKPQLNEQEQIDWNKVSRIIISSVEKTHE